MQTGTVTTRRTGSPSVGRRGFLLLGAGLLAAACDNKTADAGSPSPGRTASGSDTGSAAGPTATPSSTSPSPPTSTLPRVTAWVPNDGDIEPAVKAAAAGVVEAIGGWPAGDAGTRAAVDRVSALGQPGRLVGQAGPLLGHAAAAVVEVVEAQYGGLLSSTASVLVVCRQWLVLRDGSRLPAGTTVDVRLEQATPRWRVTALHPADPGPPAGRLSTAARGVLADPRIELPPAAEADVRSGQVHDSVLTAMRRLATSYRIGVSVVRSGHPIYVVGTDRLSDHPQGRAFDTFRIDGRLVVDPATPRSLVIGYMRAAAKAGSYNVGGPYQLAGVGSQFFSDDTHHDHVHAGFAT